MLIDECQLCDCSGMSAILIKRRLLLLQ